MKTNKTFIAALSSLFLLVAPATQAQPPELELKLPLPLLDDETRSAIASQSAAFRKAVINEVTEKDINNARQLAEKGHATAQWIMFRSCLTGVYTSIDVDEAMRWLVLAAQAGHPQARLTLGELYAEHEGSAEARIGEGWLNEAAETGNSLAMVTLSQIHMRRGDFFRAQEWYEKALESRDGQACKQTFDAHVEALKKFAAEGDSDVQTTLGFLYHFDIYGVGLNFEEAIKWYRKAAAKNNSNAKLMLGTMYEEGLIEGGMKEAIPLYLDAARQENPTAQHLIADCYAEGKGVEKDIEQAIYWYKLSAEQGDEDAQNKLKALQTP